CNPATNSQCTDNSAGNTCNINACKCGTCLTNNRGDVCLEPQERCGCNTILECINSGFGVVCLGGTNECGCNTGADCTGKNGPVCDNSQCKCLSNADCTAHPFGDTCKDGKCGCDSSANCAGGEDCKNGICEICVNDDGCTTGGNVILIDEKGPVCISSKCGCTLNSQCDYPDSLGAQCLSGKCGCATNADCTNNDNGATCISGACGCNVDADCGVSFNGLTCVNNKCGCNRDKNRAECNLVKGGYKCMNSRCGCERNKHCEDITDPLPYCHLGECVECLNDHTCRQNANGPVCSTTTFTCGCSTNADCEGAKGRGSNGPVCTAGKCVCNTNSDCSNTNQFPNYRGAVCSGGACGCTTDSDCDIERYGFKCVNSVCGCTTSGDCSSGSNSAARGSFCAIDKCGCFINLFNQLPDSFFCNDGNTGDGRVCNSDLVCGCVANTDCTTNAITGIPETCRSSMCVVGDPHVRCGMEGTDSLLCIEAFGTPGKTYEFFTDNDTGTVVTAKFMTKDEAMKLDKETKGVNGEELVKFLDQVTVSHRGKDNFKELVANLNHVVIHGHPLEWPENLEDNLRFYLDTEPLVRVRINGYGVAEVKVGKILTVFIKKTKKHHLDVKISDIGGRQTSGFLSYMCSGKFNETVSSGQHHGLYSVPSTDKNGMVSLNDGQHFKVKKSGEIDEASGKDCFKPDMTDREFFEKSLAKFVVK
ncbi:unnamed protein product, partial [Owenia fusiformis]